MSDQTFQEAYGRVRSRYNDDAWFSLHPRQITDAIYQEIRQLDAERIRATEPEHPVGPASQMAEASAAG